ncbi:MAG: TIGR01620 family protein [Alphaproteobacteria bacterium]|nr:MAG: TIGR01620 family protein [Alphaproteobacteria bacterium]
MTRRPAAFRLDDPHVIVAEEDARAAKGTVRVVPQPEDFDLPVPIAPPLPVKRRFPWGAVFWSALAGLVTLGTGLATTALIEDLYTRATWLGGLGLVLAALAGLSLIVICVKEIAGLLRLASIERLRTRAEAALLQDDRDSARAIVSELTALLSATPQLARSRTELESHRTEIIDGRDLLHIAERALMAPLDQEAARMVARAATRVSIVTAVSPRAALDMAFVLFAALGMIRRLAALYGGRPGMLGLVRLVRHIIAHLTVTGSIAAGDSLIQQMVGHGVAARVSARLGEGVLNGLLTARLGLAAIDVARPLPFAALAKPRLSDIAGDLLRRREEAARDKALPDG